MPCNNKAVWHLVVKPSGDHIPVCEEHKTCTALDLERSGEVALVPVDPPGPVCSHLTDEDLRKMLL